MNRYPKRLIEADLPIARISFNARREKDSRRGHIPQLHIYPAARPVAACRAIICAALWPDPVDLTEWSKKGDEVVAGDGFTVIKSKRFLLEAQRLMAHWAKNCLRKSSSESFPRFNAIAKNPSLLKKSKVLRNTLLDFIADFSIWDNSTDKDYLETCRALTYAAHETLGGEPNTKPLVADTFAGGGAIQLEARRCGANSYASDLNPIAVLINRVIGEFIPKYGERLCDELNKWCVWIQKQARKYLSDFYPLYQDGAVPVVYLWARVILSAAPSEEDIPVEVPIIRTMWLQRTKRSRWALRWTEDEAGNIKTENAVRTFQDGTTRKVKYPLMEVFKPKSPDEVGPGTVRRGAVTCPVTGYTTRVEDVRRQLSNRRGGTNDARLFCIVVDLPKNGGRIFRPPRPEDLKAARAAASKLNQLVKEHKGDLSLIPEESLPPLGALGFRVQRYGMKKWGDLFLHRQILILNEYCRLSKQFCSEFCHADSSFADALYACIALVIGRLADQNASLCVWQLNTPNNAHVFGRWALPMVWDYAEVNPLAGRGGSPDSAIRRMISCIKYLVNSNLPIGIIDQAPAQKLVLPDDSVQAFFTDPPYYDAIPYSDLLDFFFVWQKRVLNSSKRLKPSSDLCPKDEECIVDDAKGKDAEYFEKNITKSLRELRRALHPSGIGVVVFAHKSTSGWERLLQGVIDAGLIITASWPVDTELGIRLRAKGSAALASSVHLVCLPRENPDGSVRTDDIGDFREVLSELPIRIHEWMPRLANEGVVGADAIFACIGPALEIYSRYSSVEKASGKKVGLKEYLEHVWAIISKEALNVIFEQADVSGFEEDARLTAMWLWALRTTIEDEGETDEKEEEKVKSLHGYSLEYDTARKIAQGLGAHLENLSHLVEIKGGIATLLTAGARTRYLFGKDAAYVPRGRKKKIDKQMKLNFEAELKELEEEPGDWTIDFSGRAGSTVLDQLHQCMILFGAGRGEALRRFLVDDAIGHNPLFWRLAQALSALYPTGTDEKRWVDGVLARKKGLGF